MDWFLYRRDLLHESVKKQVLAVAQELSCSEKSQKNVNGYIEF